MNILVCYNPDMAFDRLTFISFIKSKFYEWRGHSDKNWSEYADHVGIPQATMASWKNGYLKRRPEAENQQKLINLYGPEAYSALGLPVPEVDPALADLPADLRDRYRAALLEIGTTLAKRSINPESPEARQISTDILSKYELIVSDN